MNTLHLTIGLLLWTLILLLPVMGVALGWMLKGEWDRRKKGRTQDEPDQA